MKIPLPRRREDPRAVPAGLAYDRELATRIYAGERAALERFVERHAGTIYHYLAHRLGEEQDDLAHRLTAETLSDALGKLRPYARGTAETPVELWLLRIADRRLAKSKPPRVEPPDRHDEDERDVDILRRALSRVPARRAFPVALAVYQQHDAVQMGHALGTSPAGAMRRLRAALRRLGAELEREGV
jgi:DNA-directed RNA polymerase specialized sigma24 family protein